MYEDLQRIWEWQRTGGVTLSILRREADTIAGHFRAGGYDRTASRFKVRLTDDATAINERLRELELELHSCLLTGWEMGHRDI